MALQYARVDISDCMYSDCKCGEKTKKKDTVGQRYPYVGVKNFDYCPEDRTGQLDVNSEGNWNIWRKTSLNLKSLVTISHAPVRI